MTMGAVLPNKLWISGIFDLQPGSGVVLRLCERRPDYPEPQTLGYTVIDMPAPDGEGFTVEHLKRCETIVQAHIESGGSIIVCCAAGRSRSATVIISYLMSTGKTFMEAYNMIATVRSSVDPNLRMLATLCERHGKPAVFSSLGIL